MVKTMWSDNICSTYLTLYIDLDCGIKQKKRPNKMNEKCWRWHFCFSTLLIFWGPLLEFCSHKELNEWMNVYFPKETREQMNLEFGIFYHRLETGPTNGTAGISAGPFSSKSSASGFRIQFKLAETSSHILTTFLDRIINFNFDLIEVRTLC